MIMASSTQSNKVTMTTTKRKVMKVLPEVSVEQQAANREKWKAALRSGEYKQAAKSLRRCVFGEMRYCCLGVADEILGYDRIKDGADHSSLTCKVEYAIGDTAIFNRILGLSSKTQGDLMLLNDERRMNFKGIADRIEILEAEARKNNTDVI